MSDYKLPFSWDDIEEDSYPLFFQIKDAFPDLEDLNLVCISRGGLFAGGLVAYALGIKKVHCVSLESYTADSSGANKPVQSLTDFLPSIDKNQTYLFIDDINDTSETYSFIKERCKELDVMFYFGTIYHKERENNLLPDFFGRAIDKDAWVVFPWDNLHADEVQNYSIK